LDDLFILVFKLSPPASEFEVNIVASAGNISFITIRVILANLVSSMLTADNSLSLTVEMEFLGVESVSCLNDNIVMEELPISLVSLGNNEEVSVTVEAISWMIFTSLVC
jgi:hypothetical protein